MLHFLTGGQGFWLEATTRALDLTTGERHQHLKPAQKQLRKKTLNKREPVAILENYRCTKVEVESLQQTLITEMGKSTKMYDVCYQSIQKMSIRPPNVKLIQYILAEMMCVEIGDESMPDQNKDISEKETRRH